jgi:hypothetical protein
MIKVVEYPNRYWRVADVFVDDKLVHNINKFYDITSDFIIEYQCVGGSGSGWKPDKNRVVYKLPLKEHGLTVEKG